MILLVEPDKTVTKRLCDLINRERVIGVATISQILEMLAKYKNELNVIIANISLFHEMLSSQVMFRLCKKLAIETPPIVGFYKKGNEKFKEEFVRAKGQYGLIEYNESNRSFPEQYIRLIKEVYPALDADVDKANMIWLRKEETDDLADIRNWIENQGFSIEENPDIYVEDLKEKLQRETKLKNKTENKIADIETSGLLMKEPEKQNETKHKPSENGDYEKMYFDIKKKYDELIGYVKELVDAVDNSDN